MPAIETRPVLTADDIDELRAMGARKCRSGGARNVPDRFDAVEGKAWLAGWDAARRHG